ncbi:hypothetical protein EI94DRAFT_1699179 [Lactarius quietus]|nr:hypothetical protein EI94DRAFT_1699179 [Lactarius quietus]
MAPRTRSTHIRGPNGPAHSVVNENTDPFQGSTHIGTSIHSNVTASNRNTAHPTISVPGSSSATSMASETPAKKARTIEGPTHGRPMPLKLGQESEIVAQSVYNGSAIKGKRVQCTLLFYPGRGNTNHVLAQLDQENDSFHKPNVDDAESDEEWNDSEQDFELTIKNPSKFCKVVDTESPATLQTLASGLDTLDTSANLSGCVTVVSTPGPAAKVIPMAVSATSDADVYDLVFLEGSMKVMLTHQRPIIHVVVQDAIKKLQASLLIRNTFPDAVVAFAFTKDALRLAAEQCDKPGATIVLSCLQDDEEYLAKLVSLLCACISLIRSEVKERCAAVSAAAILGIGSALEVARVIGSQLSNYTYTFLRVLPNFGAGGLIKCSLPYRNERIIAVIRELYFTGGTTSFASRFGHMFPVHFGNNGSPSRGVPIPMVALVATALYTTLYKWRIGEQQAVEFSANAYMDVYAGHVNTFRHILENRERAFHVMMSDIYARASTTPGTLSAAAPIAELNLNTLDE